ncbi:MAG: hypothetical protein AB1505_05595, partial [Candidatus Latescibacterota bacterium]
MGAIFRRYEPLLDPRRAARRACLFVGLLVAHPGAAAWAQFHIGVWTPGGHQHQAGSFDASFVASDVADLDALGIDLLVDSTPKWDLYEPPDHSLYFEHQVMSYWINRGGFVVHWAPEYQQLGLGTVDDYLEYYAGRPDAQYPVDVGQVHQRVADLIAQHSPYGTAFYGYRLGHETDPIGYGIYDQGTYGNLGAVIDEIRGQDMTRRIIAVGNVMDDGLTRWTTGEQAAFRNAFFRADAAPANILMHEQYVLWPSETSEDAVQGSMDDLRVGLDRAGDMVRTAIGQGRKAEWHLVANVSNQYDWTPDPPHDPRWWTYRVPSVSELRAQTNLALCRGAKGITYFCYTSSQPNYSTWEWEYESPVYWVDQSTPGQPRPRRQPHWDTVRAANDTLRPLGNALYPLTWTAGFPQTSIPDPQQPNNYVVSVAPGVERAEFGTFYDPAPVDLNRDYLLVVNRRDLTVPSSSQDVAVTLRADHLRHADHGPGVYFLTNVVSGERQVRSTDAGGQLVLRCPAMPPGAARLFRIERVSEWSGT